MAFQRSSGDEMGRNRDLVQDEHGLGLLRWPATLSLDLDGDAVEHQRPTPHSVRLLAFDRSGEAGRLQPARPADRLGPGQFVIVVGEEQVRERAVPVGTTGVARSRIDVVEFARRVDLGDGRQRGRRLGGAGRGVGGKWVRGRSMTESISVGSVQAGCVRASGRGADRSGARTDPDPVKTAATVPAITQATPEPSGADAVVAPTECATAQTSVAAPVAPAIVRTMRRLGPATTLRRLGFEVRFISVMRFLRVVVFEVQERETSPALHFFREESRDAPRRARVGPCRSRPDPCFSGAC